MRELALYIQGHADQGMFPPFPLPQLLSRHSTSVNAQFSSIQFSRSVVSDSVTPWIAACQASLSITNSQSLLKLMSIKSVMPSSHLILCQPLLLLPPIPPSIRVFSNESTLHIRWPKYWSFSFSISPSNEHRGLITFRMGWLDLLAVQGTLKSFLQHHSSKHQFFSAQLSSQYNSHIHTSKGIQFSSVQSLTRVQLFVTSWIAARQASLSITNPQRLLKLMSVNAHIITNFDVWVSQFQNLFAHILVIIN